MGHTEGLIEASCRIAGYVERLLEDWDDEPMCGDFQTWLDAVGRARASAPALLAACEAALAEIAADNRDGGEAHGTMTTEALLREALAAAKG